MFALIIFRINVKYSKNMIIQHIIGLTFSSFDGKPSLNKLLIRSRVYHISLPTTLLIDLPFQLNAILSNII